MARQFAIVPELPGCYGARLFARRSEVDSLDWQLLNKFSVWGGPDKTDGDMVSWEFCLARPDHLNVVMNHLRLAGYEKVTVDKIWK